MKYRTEKMYCHVPVEREFLPAHPDREIVLEFGAAPNGWEIVEAHADSWQLKTDEDDGVTFWASTGLVVLAKVVA